jgi:signal transduction histidine kinase
VLREQLLTAAAQADQVPAVPDMMQGAVERFQLTIAQLTDVSRLQQSQPVEVVNLPALVEAVRLDLAAALTAAGARLEVDLVACSHLSFSPKNLRSIICNLLSNALKYRHPRRAHQLPP